MLKLLWAHVRNIRVEVFTNKIVYTIPIYDDAANIFKFFNYKVEYDEQLRNLNLSIYKPTESLSEKPLR